MAHSVDYFTQMSHNFIFRVYVTEIPFLYRQVMEVLKKKLHTTLQDEFNNQFRENELRDYRHTPCELCF